MSPMHAHAHRKEIALRVQRQLAFRDRRAAVLVGKEALGALVAPSDRPPERARGMQAGDVLRVGEPTSCRTSRRCRRRAPAVGSGSMLRMSCAIDCRSPNAPWQPTCSVKRPLFGVVFGDRRARLHGGDHDPVVDHLEARDVGGSANARSTASKSPLAPVEADVAMPSYSRGASSRTAASGSVTTGRGSISTSISSAASCAAWRVSATITARISPT